MSTTPPGSISFRDTELQIIAFASLPRDAQARCLARLDEIGERCRRIEGDDLILSPQGSGRALAELIGRELSALGIRPDPRDVRARRIARVPIGTYPDTIDFRDVVRRAGCLTDVLERSVDRLSRALRCYETHDVVVDEVRRSVDLLRNLHENRRYFVRRVHGVTSFLPQNQPLYSTICFGVVPAYMAAEAAVRPPSVALNAITRLREVIPLDHLVPELRFSYLEREDFVRARARRTDVVVLTGRVATAHKIRKRFDRRALFIFNGAGHNPIVVTESADVNKAVASILRVTLQNQGQDCAAPNAILVHRSRSEDVKRALIGSLESIERRVGSTDDPQTIIGPNTDPDHVAYIARVFASNRRYCIYGGSMNPIDGLIRPALFERPLKDGGNFVEFYAPVVMLQPYYDDADLRDYFESEQYAEHSMYVTVFGHSPYVESLVQRGLVARSNVIVDSDLHVHERGFRPYGGSGPGASCVFIEGRRVVGPTLPQRDIFTHLVLPALARERGSFEDDRAGLGRRSDALRGA